MQLLICVDAKQPPYMSVRHNLREGKTYTLLAHKACVCGHTVYSVAGARYTRNIRRMCSTCKMVLPGAHWFPAKRFAPLNDPQAKLALVTETVDA